MFFFITILLVILFIFGIHPLFHWIGPWNYSLSDGTKVWDYSIYKIPNDPKVLMCFDKVLLTPQGRILTQYKDITVVAQKLSENIYKTWILHNLKQGKISKKRANLLRQTDYPLSRVDAILYELCLFKESR